MKTVISVPDNIFKELEKFAKEHDYTHSEVIVIALKEFLEKLKSKQLLIALNVAYAEDETLKEETIREKSKKYYAAKIEKELF